MYKEYNPFIDNGESITFKKKYTPNMYSKVHGKHLQRLPATHAAYFVVWVVVIVLVIVVFVVVMNKLLHHIRILMSLLTYAIRTVGV
jgi:hypothetical protein